MKSRRNKNSKFNFSLETKEYKRLHLLLYVLSALLIALIYFLMIILFSGVLGAFFPPYINTIITAIFSFSIGLFLVFNRDELTRRISHTLQEKKRQNIKRSNQEGLKTTLKRIAPKRNLKLKIGGKETLKHRINSFKNKFKKKDKEKPDYIEIK